jgi:PAS domain S-box-containing protein
VDIDRVTTPESAAASEITRLQGCVNDLIGVLALPAIWSGADQAEVLSTLLDALCRVLRLDLAYARAIKSPDAPPIEMVRLESASVAGAQASAVTAAAKSWLERSGPVRFVARHPTAEGNISIAQVRFGLHHEIGALVAGSRRTEFPTDTEMLLLRVAVNQASLALQEAAARGEQRRLAERLEQLVAERTRQLTALNEELVREIVERTRTESERRTLASLVENSSDFIAIASLDGGVGFVNAAGQALVGLDGDDGFRSTSVLEYVAAPDRDRAEQEVVPTVMREGRWDGELRFTHFRTGVSIPMLVHAFSIKEPGSRQPVALATISRDITARKAAEDAVQRAQSELARVARLASMGELTASIAHEVNQPIAAIITNGNACLRWLERDPPDTSEARAAVQRIIRDGNRAADVIKRIRAFLSRTDPAKTEIRVEHVIAEVVTLVRGEARARNVEVQVRCADNLPSIPGDSIQLQQVLLNLALNAVEAMSGVRDRPRVMQFGAHRFGDDAVLVEVRDSGEGLDVRSVERIFDAFYTTKPDGMGMGLAISRSIVEAHGGRLWATRNDDQGTTFQFVLPRAAAHSLSPA